MNIGISTACFYPKLTEEAFEALANRGVDVVELFFNSPSELEDDFLSKIVEIKNRSNVKIKSIHPFTGGWEPFLLFSNYFRRFEDGLTIYQRYFKTAKRLGADIVVLHGGKNSICDEEYFDRYYKLQQIAKRYNIILAQENVNLFKSQDIDFIKKMKSSLKTEVKFVFDIKQAIRADQDPYEMCRAMGENLVHVHINDYNKVCGCVLPLDGEIDYIKLRGILEENKYNGDLIIEVYNDCYKNLDEIINSCHNLKNIF